MSADHSVSQILTRFDTYLRRVDLSIPQNVEILAVTILNECNLPSDLQSNYLSKLYERVINNSNELEILKKIKEIALVRGIIFDPTNRVFVYTSTPSSLEPLPQPPGSLVKRTEKLWELFSTLSTTRGEEKTYRLKAKFDSKTGQEPWSAKVRAILKGAEKAQDSLVPATEPTPKELNSLSQILQESPLKELGYQVEMTSQGVFITLPAAETLERRWKDPSLNPLCHLHSELSIKMTREIASNDDFNDSFQNYDLLISEEEELHDQVYHVTGVISQIKSELDPAEKSLGLTYCDVRDRSRIIHKKILNVIDFGLRTHVLDDRTKNKFEILKTCAGMFADIVSGANSLSGRLVRMDFYQEMRMLLEAVWSNYGFERDPTKYGFSVKEMCEFWAEIETAYKKTQSDASEEDPSLTDVETVPPLTEHASNRL